MNFLQAILLGIVEGITEFLPISSTFHLIFTARLLHLPNNDFIKLFEVFIQSGAILSVLLLYAKDLLKDLDLVKKVLVSFVPTALVGFILYAVIKNIFFEADMLMLTVFMFVGLLFIVSEWLFQKEKLQLKHSLHRLSYRDAVVIGFIQSLAVIPGVSRAGSVILGMMFLRYRRDEAARYSFILSIPTIFMASAYDLYKMREIAFAYSSNVIILLVGFATAFVSSYIVIQWFIGFLKRNTLIPFGLYRIVLGIILLLGASVA
ncbi:undecaprenyl-diphosphate phosphatase [Candidatus Roizmanbacteria bacterium]|nr:undecaprenyl-diphosphate phosphatase [Candidatus Roizmanbacteria bacterium]